MAAVMMAWVGSVLYAPVSSVCPVWNGWRQPDSETASQKSWDSCKVGTQRPGWGWSCGKAFPQKNRSSNADQQSHSWGERQTYLVCSRKLLWDKGSNPCAGFITKKAPGLRAAPRFGHVSRMLLTGKSSREHREWSEGWKIQAPIKDQKNCKCFISRGEGWGGAGPPFSKQRSNLFCLPVVNKD